MERLKFLLQIKRWKLFCLYISVFLFSWASPFVTYILPFILIVWAAWVVSIGYNGQDFLREEKINWLTKKKYAIRVYILILIFISNFFLSKLDSNSEVKLLFILVPLTIVGLYCFYYIFIGAATVISTIEHRRKAEFWTGFGFFLRLLIFPLGVFGIQEILNREFHELY